MATATLTPTIQSKGGKAAMALPVPEVCPKCGKSMAGRKRASYLGHLSVHSWADNRGLTYQDAAYYLLIERMCFIDEGTSWNNGAWTRHKLLPRYQRIRAQIDPTYEVAF